MNRAVLQVIANSAAVVVAARLIPGISYHGGLLYLLLIGIVIGVINLIVKPVVVFLSCPLIVLTLGLFYLIVNGLMLALAAVLLNGLTIDGMVPAILGGVVLAVVNWLARALLSN